MHYRRGSSMGKTKRRLSDAREPSASDVRFCFFLCFACFLSLCVLVHVSWLSVPVPSLCFLWIAFPLFVRSFLACSCVTIRECLTFYSYALCFYLIAVVSTFPLNSVWLFDIPLIFDHSFCPFPYLRIDLHFFFIFILSSCYYRNTDHLVHRLRTAPTSSASLSLVKAAAGGGGSRTGNMAIISRSAPGGTTSISRVDSPRSWRLSDSGGSAGSMEEVKEGQLEDRDAWWVRWKERCRIRFRLLEDR